MSLQSFLGRAKLAEFFSEQDIMFFKRIDRQVVQTIYRNDVSDRIKLALGMARGLEGLAVFSNTFVLNQVMLYGPRILRLSNLDYEMLEQTEINVSLEDYRQPYDTMVVEFPEEYLIAREIDNVMAGQFSPTTMGIKGEKNKPECVIVSFVPDVKVLIANVLFRDGEGFTVACRDLDKTIQESIDQMMDVDMKTVDSLPVTEEETRVTKALMISAINACLVACEYGLDRKGPQNPKYHKRLQHFVDVAQKRGDKERIVKARKDLRQHPLLFEINQEVLLRTVKEHRKSEGHTGREVGPHNRKGHHRQQPHGPGNSLRKRKWIMPTKVNWHKFFGPDGNTKVVIKDKK